MTVDFRILDKFIYTLYRLNIWESGNAAEGEVFAKKFYKGKYETKRFI